MRIQSSCRCPASHPRVKPLQIHYCIKNGEPDNTIQDSLRLNDDAHPLEYVNDGDSNSVWISKTMDQVNLVVDLGDQFQVLMDFSLTVKAATLIFITGHGSAILSA